MSRKSLFIAFRLVLCFTPIFFICNESFAQDSQSRLPFQPQLASFIVSPTSVAPGDFVHSQFVFENQGSSACIQEERVFLHFIDTSDQHVIRWQYDHEPPVPTTFWMKGQKIKDGPLPVQVPDSIADGNYSVRVGLWNPTTNLRSLDVLLPVTLTVDRTLVREQAQPLQSIPYAEAIHQYRSLLLQRVFPKAPIQMENRKISFQLFPQTGYFNIQERETGSFWQSSPAADGLGYVMARNLQGQSFRLPLNDWIVVSESNKKCILQKNHGESMVLEMQIQINNNHPSLSVTWKTGPDWTLQQIEWNSLLWTTDALGGGAVISRLKGEYFPANSPLEFQKSFKTYNGWGGLHIPMSGILREQCSALLAWDSPYVTVRLHAERVDETLWPGAKLTSLDLHSTESSGEFQIWICEGNSYNDIAQAYREIAADKGVLVGLAEKARKNREVEKLFGAAEFKPFVCIRFLPDENGQTTERVIHSYTEDDCLQLAQHLHDDLELKKVLFVLAGWIHRGYDNQHPDILPAAPEIGGNAGVARISERVRSYGYLFGLHDNYQDIYSDSPSWDSSLVMMDRSGNRMKGGVWAGGQCWLIASDKGLELAHRNLPEIQALFSPNAYFIDTTYAAPLYESFDPAGLLNLYDDLQFKRELSRYAAKLFSVHGSETGTEFGVPVSHYFEGILSDHSFIKDYPNPGSEEIPLFPLIYHDCVAMYTHQSDRANLGDARDILRHLVMGEMPLYDIAPHQYWKDDVQEPDASNPDFCFTRCENGWGAGKHPMDRFIKNTYEFLSPVAEAVATVPMTHHCYLKPDRSVEQSRFGEHWQIVVNYGPEDFRFRETLLPPMGFVVLGPDFLAQHYYPEFGNSRTSLIVRSKDKTYIGFQ